MRSVEERLGEPLEDFLRRAYWGEGLEYAHIAQLLGIAEGTLANWMVRFRLTKRDRSRQALAARRSA